MRRLFIYSHDTYGLGHLRRCTRIGAAAVADGIADHVLIATGSPQATSYPLPDGLDVMKLPAATKDDDGRYRSRTLGVDFQDLIALRARMVLAGVEAFRPDAILVDHAPVGMGGELLPLLDWLADRPRRPRLVLGMREIVDAAGLVEEQWNRLGAFDHLSSSYDAVLVYGDAVVRTTASELGLAARLPIPVEHVGYVAPINESIARSRQRPRTIVVTPGGGGDGQRMLETYVRFVEEHPLSRQVRSVIVTGPFLDGSGVAHLVDRVNDVGAPVEVLRFSRGLDTLIATADGAVTMAGYNTVAEMLAHRVPGLLLPRKHPRVEQWLRATRLSSVASFTPIDPAELEMDHVARFVQEIVDGAVARDHQLDLGGARGATAALTRLTDPVLAGT